jgi:hypothetical protein
MLEANVNEPGGMKMAEEHHEPHDLTDDIEEGLEEAADDLQNTVKVLMELVPTKDGKQAEDNAKTRET